MKLIEAKPTQPQLSKYIDRYQYFDIREASFLRTIPNGKLDAYVMVKGAFDILNDDTGEFMDPERVRVLRASNKASLLRISSRLICLNIKLNLRMLSSTHVQACYRRGSGKLAEYFFSDGFIEKIKKLEFFDGSKLDSALLDTYLLQEFESMMQDKDPLIEELISQLEALDFFSIEHLATQMNISGKTLERLTKRACNFTPKALWNILRFETTTAHLRETKSQRLVDALSFGYYDHSHFIKECRRITGLTPGELFDRMELPTNDLAIYKGN